MLPGGLHVLLNLLPPEGVTISSGGFLRFAYLLQCLARNRFLGSHYRGLEGTDGFVSKLRAKLFQQLTLFLDESGSGGLRRHGLNLFSETHHELRERRNGSRSGFASCELGDLIRSAARCR